MARSALSLAVLALAGGLLTACGGDPEVTPAGAEPTTRVVEGAYGDVEVPTDPQRILADLMTVDYLTALGYDTDKIVGVFDASSFEQDEDHYLHDFFAGRELADPGFQYDMSLEQVAAARPDLVLLPFDQIDGNEQIEELGEIAPLLVVPTSRTRDPEVRYGGTASFQDWRSTLRAYGEVLDLEGEAEAYISDTEEQIADLVGQHGDTIADIGVTEAKSTPDYMAVNALSQARTSGVLGTILLSELGFSAPASQAGVQPDEYGTIELSRENLDLVYGDLLFLEVREGSTEHTKSPLWPTLDVVRNDGVVIVGNHWEFGGAVAAREVLRDIDAALEARYPSAG
jgi:iron complex transport system substrate-binding protein